MKQFLVFFLLFFSAIINAQQRCGTPDAETRFYLYGYDDMRAPTDCTSTSTNPDPMYDPGPLYIINVVVHILMNDDGSQGAISDPMVQSQIDILNEDFQALPGSNGANGTDIQIRFQLATEDPDGNPTTGITRHQNTTWYNDGGAYYNDLAWDPNIYMNIYTNQAGGNLGYVPFLPMNAGGALVGGLSDRVVILWTSFGRNGPIGPPYNQGRTVTHEVGHYLGLEHTFSGGCASATPPGCYTSGDYLCDTNSESGPNFGCPTNPTSCGSPDPITNYMDYTDDLCMEMFTVEQSRRMRCALTSYRTNLYTIQSNCAASDLAAQMDPDHETCQSLGVLLGANVTGGAGNYSYSWTPVDGLNDPTLLNPEATPGMTTTYTLTVTDDNSCTTQGTQTVNIVLPYLDAVAVWQTEDPDHNYNLSPLVDVLDLVFAMDMCNL